MRTILISLLMLVSCSAFAAQTVFPRLNRVPVAPSNAPTLYNPTLIGAPFISGDNYSVFYDTSSDTLMISNVFFATSIRLGNGGLYDGNGNAYLNSAEPINAPTWSGTSIVADASKVSTEFTLTNDIVFAYGSNGVASAERTFSIYFYNGSTNRTIIFPTSWSNNLWGCTLTNTALSNKWTICSFRIRGTTATAATQSNVWVRLEAQ